MDQVSVGIDQKLIVSNYGVNYAYQKDTVSLDGIRRRTWIGFSA
jgi:hypothetical protein